ncbi:MAG: hypothetical protein KF767_05120 [Bdellovibrionaceae bacterium]|nr:hypothetical protein [Pseudobdellovibrionaceae bacterium]
MTKQLVLMSVLTLSITAFAKPRPELNEAQLGKHFEFRAKAHKTAKAASQNRKPASSDEVNDMADAAQQAEQRQILADFRKSVGTSFQILEKLGQFGDNGAVARIPELLAKQIANKKSLTYKALRYQQISSIDGRNSDGGFSFPVEAKNIAVLGPIGENVDLRERCQYDEVKKEETSCSQGWRSLNYLATVHAESCHNSGCDTTPAMFQVAVAYIPAVFDSSVMEENAKPKLLKRARYEVTVEALVSVSTIDLPSSSN